MDWNNEDLSSLVNLIKGICKDVIKEEGIPCFISAVVHEINNDGTVNVYIPPEKQNIVTSKLNKTGETLYVGDSVELCCKKGRLSDSWIAIKHSK